MSQVFHAASFSSRKTMQQRPSWIARAGCGALLLDAARPSHRSSPVPAFAPLRYECCSHAGKLRAGNDLATMTRECLHEPRLLELLEGCDSDPDGGRVSRQRCAI